MKWSLLSLLSLCACINATLETTARDHQEFELVAAPIDAMVEVGFEAPLSTEIAEALENAEKPTNKLVDSVTLDGAIESAALSTDTTLAGVYGCRITLQANGQTLAIVDYDLSDADRRRSRVSLPLQNATLKDVRPLLEQDRPGIGLTLQLNPAEVTATLAMTDLAIELSADLEASL